MEIKLFEVKESNYYYNGKLLITSANSQGYIRLIINKKTYRLHRLIALKYIDNQNNYPCVDHIDGNKNNNSIDNLEWVSYSENSKRAYNNNPKQRLMHTTYKPILAKKDNIEYFFDSIRKCAKFLERDKAGVYRCLNGEWNRCNGFELSYANI